MPEMDTAEKRFSWLLKQRGYQFWTEDQLEQNIVVKGTRPDFYVETPVGNVLAEVESFVEPGPIERRNFSMGAVDPKEFADRIRGLVKHAAKQLSPYEDLGIPCLVILDNWRGIRIPLDYGFLSLIEPKLLIQ